MDLESLLISGFIILLLGALATFVLSAKGRWVKGSPYVALTAVLGAAS